MESAALQEQIAALYRDESRKVFATLVRLLGDFDRAEEALHEAFTVAIRQWPETGIPEKPVQWLISTARFKAIDALRRQARFQELVQDVAYAMESSEAPEIVEDHELADDRLRLILTCCHPAISQEAQIALTLREVCGLTTEAIADAFLTTAPTMAQRIVRAKRKIRSAGIPFAAPEVAAIPERIDAVLTVIYLVFNEGYVTPTGTDLRRTDLAREAIRLARVLYHLHPDPELGGLLALMLLTEARRDARLTSEGDLVLLEEQDRKRWDQGMIDEGTAILERSLTGRRIGPYQIQAAIAAVHGAAKTADETDWAEIAGLYEVLHRLEPSPVIALNRAVAVAMRDGAVIGLQLLDEIAAGGALENYMPYYAARAELCFRLGRWEEAQQHYRSALSLARQAPEQRHIERRLSLLDSETGPPSDDR